MWEEVARNSAAMWEDIEGEAAKWEVRGTLAAGGRPGGEVESLQAAVEGEHLAYVRSQLQSERFVHVEDIERKHYSLRGDFVVVDFGLQAGPG